jgi:hypothetical protein
MILEKILGSLFVKDNLAISGRNFTALETEVNNHGTRINNLDAEIDSHKTETVSQVINASRDISLAGIQTIETLPNRKIKAIMSFGAVQGTKKWTQGMWAEGSSAYCNYSAGDTSNYYTGTAILLFSNTTAVDRTIGNLAVYDGFFQINWSKTGAGATGTADFRFLVLYHD